MRSDRVRRTDDRNLLTVMRGNPGDRLEDPAVSMVRFLTLGDRKQSYGTRCGISTRGGLLLVDVILSGKIDRAVAKRVTCGVDASLGANLRTEFLPQCVERVT